MFVSAETSKIVIQKLLDEAKAKAGSQNAFSRHSGLNNTTVWRASQGRGAFSAKSLIATIAFVGGDKSGEIIENTLKSCASQNRGTVGEYLQSFQNAVEVRKKRIKPKKSA